MLSKNRAIKFLAYLHKQEKELRNNIFKTEELKNIENIRKKFLEEYMQSKKGFL